MHRRPPAPAHEETRAIMDSIRRVVQVLRESSRAAEKLVGLSGAQLFVLQRLADGEALSLGELAERTATHQSSVSVVASRLGERGLVERRASRGDRRRVELTVTAQGRRLLDRAPGAAQERLIDAIERLPPAKRRALADGLATLVASMDVDAAPPAMLFEESTGRRRAAPRKRDGRR